MTFEIPIDKEPSRGKNRIIYKPKVSILYLAQTAHIKDKLNVTTAVRTRKDKIGKVNFFFQLRFNFIQKFS